MRSDHSKVQIGFTRYSSKASILINSWICVLCSTSQEYSPKQKESWKIWLEMRDRGGFWALYSVGILVFASPTSYMLTSFDFSILIRDIFHNIPPKWSVILLQSWTSTGYFSNSSGSSVTNCRFSPIISGGICWKNYDYSVIEGHLRLS